MSTAALRSFAKINLGLKIGPLRVDGFHELRTIYQTIALHDIVHVEVAEGEGIEIRCNDPRVPCDATNTCYKIAERVLQATGKRSQVVITIDKQLPVQGGMGAASSNAVAAMLGLERALGIELPLSEKLRIAAEVGSDLPLFLIGGTVLGVDRGQEVAALQDLPEMSLVVVTPPIGVPTPKAFAQWDALMASERALTDPSAAGTMKEPNQAASAWLSETLLSQVRPAEGPASGVPAAGGDRAEIPLLDLVRTGIENDFERVVFPEYPELCEVKNVLQREGARYASLSGSGSTLYGLFESASAAEAAAERMRAAGHVAVATRTVGRAEYWEQLAASN
ncbi:MAG TPA: 4-(cytidine 5'-diphospho)-2-C-methyl-D-erythritol kinase [Candidatus Eisenbacteria bacterium]|nr:4-(cytidine 5'-diphospho)-2-C-methyl-D-erythritol kinase [Candidatus Eisenbacteria bacterium]